METRWTTLRAWALLLPLLVVIIAIIGWPLASTIALSFTDAKLVGTAGDAVGVANYQKALTNPAFTSAFLNTAFFSFVSVGIEIVAGVLAALLLDQEFRGRTLLRGLMILPWALPTIVNATLWRLIYNPEYGALNALLTQFGLISDYRSWLGDPNSAMASLIIADAWKNFPLVALIALAALQTVPKEIKAAAIVDGAGLLARFRFFLDANRLHVHKFQDAVMAQFASIA